MKITAGQVERFLRAPDSKTPVVLIYGPDEGLVRERAARLIKAVLDDPTDPFRLSDLAADQIRSDPSMLADEARALCMMGGRRVVRVRQVADALRVATKSLLALETIDALVVLEGGDLGRASSLRKLIEQAPNAATIPCYRDEGGDLGKLIDHLLKERHLRPDAEARTYLIEHLGGDRAVTRTELDKLALFADASAESPRALAFDDVACMIGDSAAVGLDDLAHATTLGDAQAVERCLNRLLGEGQAPVRLIRTLLNHITRLYRLALLVERGEPVERAIGQARPPIHFRRKADVKTALRRWNGRHLRAAQAKLLGAEMACKTTGRPDVLLCREAIFSLCRHSAS
ncbi:MAG: DNA polymerase III subunit delta [Alphaproteobacteria bacterium]|nr:DNA polymerase III subunit delta [Alphaproteobacteria bacterium]